MRGSFTKGAQICPASFVYLWERRGIMAYGGAPYKTGTTGWEIADVGIFQSAAENRRLSGVSLGEDGRDGGRSGASWLPC